jgi:uncharacterized protein (TIGR02147 family)
MNSKRLSTPVFAFEDYIEFLDSWLAYARRFGLTKQNFIENAGMKCKTYLSDILSGRKKIGKDHIPGLIKALELNENEARYFTLLVYKKISRDPNEIESFLREIAFIRKKHMSTILNGSNVEYYSSWRYMLIMEYIRSRRSIRDISEIKAAFLFHRLSEKEILKCLKKLISWEMVVHDKSENIYYAADEKQIITFENMPHAVVNDLKRSLIESSVHAMEKLPREDRHISMALRGLSHKAYTDFCCEVDILRKKFLEMADDKDGADNVYSLNFQLFPLMDLRNKNQKQEQST